MRGGSVEKVGPPLTPPGNGGRLVRQNLFVLSTLVALAGCQKDGTYPQRPIVLLCPWSAGGGSDSVSRQLATLLERDLGVPVNVINATGGAGVTGHIRGALARPDGYTVTLVTVELNMLHWRQLTNITHRDYEPLALVNRDAAALFVRDDAPWRTVGELVQAIRKRPRGLRASGTAFGGIWHVALAGWLTRSGLNADDLVWISINGAAPSLQELLAGGVAVACCSVAEARSLMDAERIRCLAVMADRRSEAAADVPTLKEQGVDWSMGTWRGLAAPRGLPSARTEMLAAAIRRVVTSDEYLVFMRNSGFGASFEPPDRFAAELVRTDRQFGTIFNSPAFDSVRKEQFGPMLFPTLLAASGLIVLLAMATTGRMPGSGTTMAVTRAGLLRIGLVLVWVTLYVLLADTVGFVVVAAALTWFMMWRLGVRPIVAAGIVVVLVPAVYQVFAVGLRVPLPRGWLDF